MLMMAVEIGLLTQARHFKAIHEYRRQTLIADIADTYGRYLSFGFKAWIINRKKLL